MHFCTDSGAQSACLYRVPRPRSAAPGQRPPVDRATAGKGRPLSA